MLLLLLSGFISHSMIHIVGLRGFAYPISPHRMSEGLNKLNELFYSVTNHIDGAVAARLIYM